MVHANRFPDNRVAQLIWNFRSVPNTLLPIKINRHLDNIAIGPQHTKTRLHLDGPRAVFEENLENLI
jgi:hypothetical protein